MTVSNSTSDNTPPADEENLPAAGEQQQESSPEEDLSFLEDSFPPPAEEKPQGGENPPSENNTDGASNPPAQQEGGQGAPAASEQQAPPANQPGVPDAVRDEIAALRAQVEELKALRAEVAKTEEKKELEIEEVEFVKTEDDIRAALDSPESFNKLLNNVMKLGVTKGREMALSEMPTIAQAQAREVVNRRAVISNFFTTNSDLAPLSDKVQEEATAIAAKGEKKYESFAELLADAEVVVRQKYNKPKPTVPQGQQNPPAAAPQPKPNNNRQPAFAGAGASGRKPSPGEVGREEQDLRDLFG